MSEIKKINVNGIEYELGGGGKLYKHTITFNMVTGEYNGMPLTTTVYITLFDTNNAKYDVESLKQYFNKKKESFGELQQYITYELLKYCLSTVYFGNNYMSYIQLILTSTGGDFRVDVSVKCIEDNTYSHTSSIETYDEFLNLITNVKDDFMEV